VGYIEKEGENTKEKGGFEGRGGFAEVGLLGVVWGLISLVLSAWFDVAGRTASNKDPEGLAEEEEEGSMGRGFQSLGSCPG